MQLIFILIQASLHMSSEDSSIQFYRGGSHQTILTGLKFELNLDPILLEHQYYAAAC